MRVAERRRKFLERRCRLARRPSRSPALGSCVAIPSRGRSSTSGCAYTVVVFLPRIRMSGLGAENAPPRALSA
jgi:hypothetical protein